MRRILVAVTTVAVLCGLFGPSAAAAAPSVPGQLAPLAASPTSTVDIELTWDESGWWTLRADGHIGRHNAPDLGTAAGQLRAGEQAVSMSVVPGGGGYWVFTTLGRVLVFGNATHYGDMSAVTLNGPVIDSVATPTGLGYYMVASDGGVFTFGDAAFYGSMGGKHLNGPVNGLAPTADNKGYWLVADDGGIFSFGTARFYGSMGGTRLNRPVVGMVGQGDGYLMVGADGGIFNFGQSRFHGSLGGNPPATPVVAVAPKRDLSGYRMITEAGQVAEFGNTGSAPSPEPTYEVPGAARNVGASQAGVAAQISLSFDAPANAAVANISGYEASCDGSELGSPGPVFGASGASSPLTVDVEVGRWYVCQVRAVGSEGAGAWAAAGPVAVGHAAPANVQVVAGDGEVTVSWDPVDATNLGGYSWIRSTSEDGGLAGSGDVDADTTSVTIGGLANGEAVWVTVYAESSVANVFSALSVWVSATPTANPTVTVPSAPLFASSVQGDGAEISVAFTAPADNGGAVIDDYEAECDTGAEAFTATGAGSPLVVDVEYGLTYECEVRAHNSEGWGPWADAHGAPVPHPAPTNLQAVAGDGEVTLTWDPVPAENLGSYTVQSAPAEDGPWTDAATGVTATSVTIDGLVNGTEVWFRVAALSTVPLGSDDSSAVSATPTGPDPSVAVNEVVVTAGGDDTQISWPAYLEQGEDLSANGRYAVFATDEDGLVAGDTNGVVDVFVRDLTDGTITRVSVAGDGSEANERSLAPSISANGRYIAFMSLASNLDPDHTSPTNVWDVYVRDTVAGTTTNISRANEAGEVFAGNPSISADGQRVAYVSYHDGSGTPNDVDVWDATIDDSTQIGELGWHLRNPVLSADGSTVAFEVDVAKSTGFEETNNITEIWVHDIDADVIERITHRTGTAWSDEMPSISGDGRYVASQIGLGGPGQLVALRDRVNGTSTQVGSPLDGGAYSPNLSDDGQWLAFHGGDYLYPLDANRQNDVFVQPIGDQNSRVLVPRAPDGSQGDSGSWSPVLSGDGASVLFTSTATNLTSVDLNTPGGGLFVARLRDGSGTAVYPDPSTLPAPDPSRPYRVEALAGSEGASELTLTFNPPANAGTVPVVHYEAECVGLAGTNPEFDTSGATSPLVVDVDPGMVYNCQVRAVGEQGPGPWMWADYITARHPAPTNLHATQDGGDVTISWDPVDGTNLRGYMVTQIEPLNEFGFPRIFGWEIQETSVTVSDLVAGETVRISVWAVAEGFISGVPAIIEVTPTVPVTVEHANELVTQSTNGTQIDVLELVGTFTDTDMSADGRYVVFATFDGELVPGDTNYLNDVFLRDTVAGTLERISVSASGVESDKSSGSPRLSADGRYVVFSSVATNLIDGETNTGQHLYRRDNTTGEIVKIADALTAEGSISADGQRIAYWDGATGTTHIWDADTGTTATTGDTGWRAREHVLSADGNTVAFTVIPDAASNYDETDNTIELWVYQVDDDSLTRITPREPGIVYSDSAPSLSDDGQLLAFERGSTAAGGVYLWDAATSTTTAVTAPYENASNPVLSGDGNWIAFAAGDGAHSSDGNVFDDVFIQPVGDPSNRILVPIAPDGTQANGPSGPVALSADGSAVLFWSAASNLAPDANGSAYDLFIARLRDSNGNPTYPDPSVLPAPPTP